MEDQWRITVQQVAKQRGKTGRIVVHEGAVSLLHQAHRVLRRQLVAGLQQLLHALQHRRLDRQGVRGHPRQLIRHCCALSLTPKVVGPRQAQVGERGHVIRRQRGQMVRAEQPPPPHRAPAQPGVAAQITKVGGTGEVQGAGRSLHSVLLLRRQTASGHSASFPRFSNFDKHRRMVFLFSYTI